MTVFLNSKESKFKVNVLKLNKIDKIRNFVFCNRSSGKIAHKIFNNSL